MKRQLGYALLDAKMGLLVFTVVTMVSSISFFKLHNSYSKKMDLSTFVSSAFNAMETQYWNSFALIAAPSRCLSDPALAINFSDIDGDVPRKYQVDGWFNQSLGVFRYIRIANSSRTQVAMEIELTLTEEEPNKYQNTSYAFDTSQNNVIVFRKMFSKSIPYTLVHHLDDNGCT